MRLIAVTVAAAALAGCAKAPPPQTLIKTEQVVIIPDRTLFNCPNVRRFPNPDTLTDAEVAKLLVTLHKNNTDCQKNINTIWKTLDAAKKTAEKKD
jgi:hypothetical protein